MMSAAEALAEAHRNGRVVGATTSRDGTTVYGRVRRGWPRFPRAAEADGEKRPGWGLIRAATVLLFALGLGLLIVSFAAQYRYVFHERQQSVASVIEAGALDVGMVIFSLLALGLARAGLAAKVERALIVACAAGSAVMNYAAADVSSPRSVLAYCMPPVFLAVVVDRVVVSVRRHVLGMREGRSPWTVLGIVVLYGLRLFLALPSTAAGLRRWVLEKTPLPGSAATVSAAEHPALPTAAGPAAQRSRPRRRRGGRRGPSKTSRFLELVEERYGPLASIPLDRVSPISTELAPQVDLDTGAARTALGKAVRTAHEAAAALREGGSQ